MRLTKFRQQPLLGGEGTEPRAQNSMEVLALFRPAAACAPGIVGLLQRALTFVVCPAAVPVSWGPFIFPLRTSGSGGVTATLQYLGFAALLWSQ